MKTFKELIIGDLFYKVYTNYEGEKSPKYTTIKVKRIEVQKRKEVEMLAINYNESSNYDSADLRIPFRVSDVDYVLSEDGFFTTDYNKVVQGFKDTAMKFIQKYKDNIEVERKKIESIRIAYYDYLNNYTTVPILQP